MEPTPAPPPPLLSATTTAPATTAAYPDSLDSSPRSRNTDSWGDDNSLYPSNNVSAAAAAPPVGLTKLRLMCSYGGHIVPRPHDKSLCYVGGDTRIVVVDRHTTLSDLTHRLSKTLLRSPPSMTSAGAAFTLKYQLPSEDLDSLISVTTDEDLENMIEEYERLNSASDGNKSSRLRLFLFPTKSESVSSIGSLLENTTKSEDWFLNALNGTTSGFSDSSSVNCLLGLDEDVSIQEKKYADNKAAVKNLRGNNSGQDVHSVPDLERSSSFGSASSAPSLASLPPIRVHVDDTQKVGGGIEEQFSQMSVQQHEHKHQDDGGYAAPPVSAVVTVVPVSSVAAMSDYPNRALSEDERSEQGFQVAYQQNLQQQQQNLQQQHQNLQQQQHQQHQQHQQYQQKQSTGFDLASPDSVSSDGSLRQKPPMIYQDPVAQTHSPSNNNPTPDLNNFSDQNTRNQMQQIQDSGYVMSMSTNQFDPQHPQSQHQQPQFIHTAVPPQQYVQHPSGAVPLQSYYQMYPPPSQHPAFDPQNIVYYMPSRQAPHGYNLPLQQQQQQQPPSYADSSAPTAAPSFHNQPPPPVSGAYSTTRAAQTAPKSELYRTTNQGGPQLVQIPSGQHQPQPQYVGYSQIHHPSQSVASSASSAGGNYGYEYPDPAQGQHAYYAAQQMPPQSAAQYQTMTSNMPTGEAASHIPTDNSMKQQQGRTSQP